MEHLSQQTQSGESPHNPEKSAHAGFRTRERGAYQLVSKEVSFPTNLKDLKIAELRWALEDIDPEDSTRRLSIATLVLWSIERERAYAQHVSPNFDLSEDKDVLLEVGITVE